MQKTRASERVEKNNQLWREFVLSGKFSKGLKAEDVNDASFNISLLGCVSYKDDALLLKKYLTPDGFHRFDLRFRAFKYRSKSDVTTISVSKNTLEKLKAISKKSGFTDTSYDFILELLMSSENELEPVLQDQEVELFNSSLDQSEKGIFLKQTLKLRGPTWRMIVNQIEFAFSSGWYKCQHLQGKKRTEAALLEESQLFMDKFKGLI